MSGQRGVALITGGEGDLARAIAEALAASGFGTVHRPSRHHLDVTDTAAIDRYFSKIPHLDLLVINAAVLHDAPLHKMGDADWSGVLRASLDGAFFCIRSAARLMVAQRSGHIVTIGSHSALTGPAGQANYSAAKAGLIGLTKSLAAELGPSGIRSNCVLPGFLETRLTRSVTPARKAEILASQALGRFANIQDAARFIAFLHGMENVSGQVFQLDSRVGRW
ncbi:3-oxoacyl-ACP reductase FabG [soil metagenome]